MSQKLSAEDGKYLVAEARKCLESRLSGKDHKITDNIACLDAMRGIFVTLHTHPDHDLRGCIGFIEPVYTLRKGIKEAAISAAIHDPRFPEVTRDELDQLIIEISILTQPEPILNTSPNDLLSKITPKKDGLIMTNGNDRGLFLPQVWEDLPDKIQFLENLCLKAGILEKAAWQYKDTEISRFRVQIFMETEPKGKIIEVME